MGWPKKVRTPGWSMVWLVKRRFPQSWSLA